MSWDKYFYDITNAVASNSKCLSRQIGAILVQDKTIIGSGYNGPPRGIPHCRDRYEIDELLKTELDKRGIKKYEHTVQFCPRQTLGYKSGQGLEWCVAGHAERNALINSARLGIKTFGTKMYMNCGTPCTPCLVEIINAGIEEIIITKYNNYDLMAPYLLEYSSLKVRLYDFTV